MEQDIISYSFTPIVLLLFLGAAHGFYLTILALASVKEMKANLFMAFFLFAFSYSLLNAFLFESGYMIHFKFMMGTGMPFQFLIGPSFYLYVAFVLGEKKLFQPIDSLHFAPVVLTALAAMPYYLKPGIEKIADLGTSAVNVPIERAWYLGLQLLLTIIYLYFVFQLLAKHRKNDAGWLWLKNINTAFWVLTFIYLITTPLFFTIDSYLVEIRTFFQISISLFIHLVGFLILRKSHILGKIGRPKLESSLSTQQMEVLEARIKRYMMEQEPWLRSDFTLPELSEAIDSNSLYTSTVLNQSFGKHFNDFVNEYRVLRAKELLSKDEIKLFAVALESGFANKNSFNRVFKKFTGQTPSEYRKNQVTI